jgi:hypothetical protein
MGVKVSTDWKFNELSTIILENEKLSLTLFPELGSKIWKIHYKPKDKDILWHHPRLKPRKIPFHSVYDDTFFGGWDELFPNDSIEFINGEKEPDHGEIWALPWEYRIEKMNDEEITIHLWVDTVICSSRIEKKITLRAGESVIHFSHKITNTGQLDMPFLWKLHAAIPINEHCRIDLPAEEMYIEDFGPTRLGKTQAYYQWPHAVDDQGNSHDMRHCLPQTAQINEFQYATRTRDGWCSITDTSDRIGFGLVYDHNILPSCWIFATYGGWRNLQTVILEPCTGYPLSIVDGVSKGTHKILAAGEVLECDIKAVIYEGFESVSRIEFDGTVFGK